MTAMPHDPSRPLAMSVPTMRRTSTRAGHSARAEQAQRRPSGNLAARVLQVRPLAKIGTKTFLLLVAAALALSLGLMLALNTLMAQGSFQRYELMMTKSNLVITEQSLEGTLASLDTPAALATRAESMGMVMNPNPAFIDLSTRQLLGEPAIAEPPDPARDFGTSGEVNPTTDIGGEIPLGLQPFDSTTLTAGEPTG